MRRLRKASSRIALVGTVATMLMLLLFALLARTATRSLMYADLDDELETLSIAIGSDLESRGLAELAHDTLRAGIEANTLVYRLEHHSAVVFDRNGVIAASGDLGQQAEHAEVLPFAERSEKPFTAREPFTPHHRLCRFRVTHLAQNAAGATLLVFRSIDGVSRALQTIDLVLASLVLAGSAASALILTIAVRRALMPVERITSFSESITARDLSQRVTVEAAGEEFDRLGSVINSLLERLESSFAAQRRLVSDAAHELKTPTAVIAAEAQELSRGTLSPVESEDALRVISRAAAGLAREVDDLVELARGDAAPPVREPFDLDDAVDEAVATAGALGREREIVVKRNARGERTLIGDRAGLVRAVANLLSNAIRYSPPNSEVTVETKTAGDVWAIDVADRGPGIPPADRRRIFERFVRLAQARREHPEGSGLGLAIVEQVVSAHGGTVEVHERKGGGALFRITLPRAAGDVSPSSAPEPSTTSSS